MLSISTSIQDAYDGTPLEGLEMDVYELTPSNLVATLPIASNKPGKAPSGSTFGCSSKHPLLKKSVTSKTLKAMRSIRDEVAVVSPPGDAGRITAVTTG